MHKVRPKTFGYDIPKLNNDLKFKFEMVRAGSPKQDATNFDPEFSFYLYQAYESIKSPLAWIQFIINMKQETARGTKTIISAMEDAELQMKDLECDGNWKPNDQDPEERMRTSIVAMLAKRGPATGSGHGTDGGGSRPSGKTPGNGNPDPKDNPRKSLPFFIKEPGKPGDTRTHNGKTFYYCKDPNASHISIIGSCTTLPIVVTLQKCLNGNVPFNATLLAQLPRAVVISNSPRKASKTPCRPSVRPTLKMMMKLPPLSSVFWNPTFPPDGVGGIYSILCLALISFF